METNGILSLLKNRTLLWGSKFFCSGLYVAPHEMRSKAIVICAQSHRWVSFTCKWIKKKGHPVSSYLSIGLHEFPSSSSGYPHTEIDLNSLGKIKTIDVYRQGDQVKAVFMRFRREFVCLFAEDPAVLPAISIIREKSLLKKMRFKRIGK
jgi:hypothetical protein